MENENGFLENISDIDTPFLQLEEFIEWYNNRPLESLESAKFAAMPHEWIACPFSGLVPIKENLI